MLMASEDEQTVSGAREGDQLVQEEPRTDETLQTFDWRWFRTTPGFHLSRTRRSIRCPCNTAAVGNFFQFCEELNDTKKLSTWYTTHGFLKLK